MTKNRIRRVTGNIISLLSSDVANRGSTFILYALVGRYLGAFEFGQFSLGITFFYMFQVFAGVGLKTLVTREIAKDKTKTEQFFVNSSAVVMVTGLLSITSLFLLLRLLNYTQDTTSIILVISLGLLPASLSVICEAVFVAWEKMHYIAYASISGNIAKVVLAFLILVGGYPLIYLVIMLFFIRLIILGIQWWLIGHKIIKPRLRIDLDFSLRLVKSSTTFMGIEGIPVIGASLNIIILSKFASETEAGLFNAGRQLMLPIAMILSNFISSVFPIMVQKFAAGAHKLNQVSEYFIEVLFSIALPAVVGIYFLADSVLLLVYGGKDFLDAAAVLRIMVWGLLFTAFIHVFGHILLARYQEKVTLRIVVINLIVRTTCAFFLIWQFGLIGAAMAGLVSEAINLVLHYIPVSGLFSKITIGRVVWKPIIAVTGMALYLAMFENQGLLYNIVSAGFIYTITLLALTIWSSGGVNQFKTKYLQVWR